MELLRQIIYNPYIENNAFSKEYVEQEKENHRIRIESKINDKRSYAVNRCIEEMCKYEDFSLYSLGYVEDIDSINEINLYQQYKNILNTSQIEIFFVGDYDEGFKRFLIDNNRVEIENPVDIPREKIITRVEQRI